MALTTDMEGCLTILAIIAVVYVFGPSAWGYLVDHLGQGGATALCIVAAIIVGALIVAVAVLSAQNKK